MSIQMESFRIKNEEQFKIIEVLKKHLGNYKEIDMKLLPQEEKENIQEKRVEEEVEENRVEKEAEERHSETISRSLEKDIGEQS